MTIEELKRMEELCAYGTRGEISTAEHNELQRLIKKENRESAKLKLK